MFARSPARSAPLCFIFLSVFLYATPLAAQQPDAPPPDEREDSEEDEAYMMPAIGGGAEAAEDEEDKNKDKDDAVPVETQVRQEAATPAPQEERALETPDVVITGTRLEREADDAPVRTQVIEREQIQKRKARNLAESLNYTTGVRVENNCQNCGFTQLRLNGLSGAYTQILIDGLPSFSGLASVYGLEQIPAEMIQRVEVVKGGGSALYGSSAVAGVVNVITRRPQEDFLSALTSYDAVGLEAPDLRVAVDGGVVTDSGDVGAHVFATTRRRDALDLNGDGFTELTRIRQLAGGLNLFVTPFAGSELRVSFHALQEYRRGGDNLDLPPHEVGIAEELQTERLQGDIRWDHRVSDLLSYSLGYVLAFTDRRSYYGGGGDVDLDAPDQGEPADEEFIEDFEAERVALGGYGRTRNPLHVGDAHANFAFDAGGPQVVTVGAQVNVDDIEDEYLGYDRVIDDTYTILGAYLQHDWIFADWGESVVGVRVDQHSELQAPIASPRAALLVRPTNWLRLRSAFSTGFRAPQAFDEDLHIETAGGAARILTNAPNLEPERSMTLAQQATTKTTLAGGHVLSFGVNGYLNRLTNAFVINERDDPDTPEEEIIRSNRGTTTVLGAEVTASVNAEWWAMRAGWTFENAENDDPDEDFGRTRIYRTPRHYGYVEGLIEHKAWQVQTGLDLTGPMLVPRYDSDADPLRVETSPWFAVLNINVSYAALALDTAVIEPFIGARNLFDSRQRDFDTGADRDSNYIYGPPQPRTLFAGIRGTL